MNDAGSIHFFKKVSNFSRGEKKKVHAILIAAMKGHHELCHYTVDGSSLLVRNKSSADVPSTDSQFLQKINYAKKYNLWHIHAGFYNVNNEYPIFNGYKKSVFGDLVSDWMLHYSYDGKKIYFIDATPHPMQIFNLVVS